MEFHINQKEFEEQAKRAERALDHPSWPEKLKTCPIQGCKFKPSVEVEDDKHQYCYQFDYHMTKTHPDYCLLCEVIYF